MNGRMYDPALGRFLSPDPNIQMPGYSPNHNRYSYVLNNPLKYTDPSGEDIWGDLFSGLQIGVGVILQFVPGGQAIGGQLIVSGATHFLQTTSNVINQGMSWEAGSNAAGISLQVGGSFTPQWGMGKQQVPNTELFQNNYQYQNNGNKSYDGIMLAQNGKRGVYSDATEERAGRGRPDADGHLNIFEANSWYRNGGGQSLYVNLGNYDLSGITVKDSKGVGDVKSFNLQTPKYAMSANRGLVFGSISLKYVGNNQVVATSAYDIYDFDYKPLNGTWERVFRNFATFSGNMLSGPGDPFIIYIMGTGTIK